MACYLPAIIIAKKRKQKNTAKTSDIMAEG